jgi:hypothetical protein
MESRLCNFGVSRRRLSQLRVRLLLDIFDVLHKKRLRWLRGFVVRLERP